MIGRVLTVNLAASAEPNPAKHVGLTGIGKRPVESAVLRAPGPKHGGDLGAARLVLAGECLPDDEADWLRQRIERRTS